MDPNGICFIFCVNDEAQFQKSAASIHALSLPDGFRIEIASINNASSMTSGYNMAMKHSKAKYKVYLHQDVSIANRSFIIDMLRIFEDHPKLGMMGLIGAKTLPSNGIWWEAREKYGKVLESHTGQLGLLSFKEVADDYQKVAGVDGFLVMTQYDVPWREDLFVGWHFYDMSQSMEFIRAGYEVGIPRQSEPWCVHDCGVNNLNNGFERDRQIFLKEYKDAMSSSDARHYDEKPESYYKGVNRFLLNRVRPAMQCVLDIGCAEGNLGRAIKDQYGSIVYGFEYYPAAADEAEKKLDRVFRGDIETDELPLEPGTLDCVIFGDVLEHMRDPWQVLAKVKPYLKPGGVILACLPNAGHISMIMSLLNQSWTYVDQGLMDKTHLRFFTLSELYRLFEAGGYRIEHAESIPYTNDRYESVIHILDEVRRAFSFDMSFDFKHAARAYQYVIEASIR